MWALPTLQQTGAPGISLAGVSRTPHDLTSVRLLAVSAKSVISMAKSDGATYVLPVLSSKQHIHCVDQALCAHRPVVKHTSRRVSEAADWGTFAFSMRSSKSLLPAQACL